MGNIKTLGVMLDCSRNAVMNIDFLKKYIKIIADMGYNALMLYTEDTFEVDNEPFFGRFRGRYSKEELKEINRYCLENNIELIPCIQTLAHLNAIFKWREEYDKINDCDDILLIDDERTYTLIDNMFSSISQCFTSKKIHIGMDEAYRVGLGKYLSKNGYKDRFDVINNHLHKVCKIADKYGFEPMIWSDMFCKLALQTTDYYKEADLEQIRKKADLPDNVSLVYWDYYSKDKKRYENMIKTNKAFQRPVVFAGGAWTWRGFAPDNKFSMETLFPAITACKENEISDIFITLWGDDGAECSKASVLPSLMYAAETVKGNNDIDKIKEKFKKITGADFDSFMLLDKLDTPGGKHYDNPSKYLLYNDPFTGIKDYLCKEGDNFYYENLAKKLNTASGKGDFSYIFNTLEKLCNILAVKSELGIKTRKAYMQKDKKELERIANEEYNAAIERIKEFYKEFKKQWMKDNKPYGFDVQDIRLGGLIMRLEDCKDRILQYVNGETESIHELSEPILECSTYNSWGVVSTPNVLSHIF